MRTDKASPTVHLRVIVVSPPKGVGFAIQRGRADLLPASKQTAELIQFDFSLRVAGVLADGSPNYLGEFSQGTPTDRFVYINSGTLAGQHASGWTRRAKLKLGSIPREMAEAAIADPDQIIEAQVQGTMADGGPICASIKPHSVSWSLRKL